MGCSPTPRGGPAGPRSTHRHKKGLTASPSVSVSWGYGNKEPQTSGMEKTEVHFPTGLEARSLKSRGGRALLPRGLRGGSFLPFPASGCGRRSWAFRGCWPHSSSFCPLSSHGLSCASVSKCPLLVRTLVTGLRATLIHDDPFLPSHICQVSISTCGRLTG